MSGLKGPPTSNAHRLTTVTNFLLHEFLATAIPSFCFPSYSFKHVTYRPLEPHLRALTLLSWCVVASDPGRVEALGFALMRRRSEGLKLEYRGMDGKALGALR